MRFKSTSCSHGYKLLRKVEKITAETTDVRETNVYCDAGNFLLASAQKECVFMSKQKGFIIRFFYVTERTSMYCPKNDSIKLLAFIHCLL